MIIFLLLVLLLVLGVFLQPSPLITANLPNNTIGKFYTIYITKAITNTKILPNTYPLPGSSKDELLINACRGEYEPATFIIRAHQKILGLKISATNLTNGQFSIPNSAVDISVLKCWFQAGNKVQEINKIIFTPELLLKDEMLVKVDLIEKKNYLRFSGIKMPAQYVLINSNNSENLKNVTPRDAKILQSVDIDANSNKQFWVTLYIPKNTTPGRYEGKINFSAANAPFCAINLRVQVLPFDLEKPTLRYSIYYRGKLSPNNKGSISSEWKSSQQYLAEMRNLKAHGVEYPTIYQDNLKEVGQELELREQADLPKDALYTCGLITGNPSIPAALEMLKKRVREWVGIGQKFGYRDVYVYGIDEAKGDILQSQRLAWSTVRQAEGKVFAATQKGNLKVIGDMLDLAVLHGSLDPQEAKAYHQIGHQVFSYHNPQVGEETPETYRRNYGLLLWKSGYDGAMDYAYQHGFGHIWNDFDHVHYRDHVFAYPTTDGVIDTIQWEGFREGVDDIRYLTTLLKFIKKAMSKKPQLATQAQVWVDNLNPHADLDDLRATMVDLILKLQ